MYYEFERKLLLDERKELQKRIDSKCETGLIITDIIHNNKYSGMLIIPHDWEDSKDPIINVLDLDTSKEFDIPISLKDLSNITFNIGEDSIKLTIK